MLTEIIVVSVLFLACWYFLASGSYIVDDPIDGQTKVRATEEEKQYQIDMLTNLHQSNQDKVNQHLNDLQEAAIKNENLFEHLMEATKVCSLGQITSALFEVGGQYRRNM